jgi:hypothetical protein
LKRLWSLFPAEQTLVFKSEELQERAGAVLERIATFLGIAPFPPLDAKVKNTRQYNTAISEEEKRYLVGMYRDDIAELERLLGWDCSSWLE